MKRNVGNKYVTETTTEMQQKNNRKTTSQEYNVFNNRHISIENAKLKFLLLKFFYGEKIERKLSQI